MKQCDGFWAREMFRRMIGLVSNTLQQVHHDIVDGILHCSPRFRPVLFSPGHQTGHLQLSAQIPQSIPVTYSGAAARTSMGGHTNEQAQRMYYYATQARSVQIDFNLGAMQKDSI
jgi:hypothetical protein